MAHGACTSLSIVIQHCSLKRFALRRYGWKKNLGTWFQYGGNTYVDWMCSWGPLIAGHAHPGVVAAIQDAATRGTSPIAVSSDSRREG